jgi:hypothetical protein
MNLIWDNDLTRWEQLDASLDALPVDTVARLQNDSIFSLIRFGHDPGLAPGTMVVGDDSGIIDGRAHDVTWADCGNWMDVLDAMDVAGEPMDGAPFGMGSWLEGTMDFALQDIQAAKLLPENAGREYRVILIFQGHWAGQDGTPENQQQDSPVPFILTLNQIHDVPTYVVTMDPDTQAKIERSNELALAGGTGAPYLAYMGNELTGMLTDVIEAALGNTSCD